MSPPTGFVPGAGAGFRPDATPPVRPLPPAPLPRVVATLTLYDTGEAVLSAQAARLFGLASCASVCLQAPPRPRTGRRPAPWVLAPGACHRLLHHPEQAWPTRFSCPPAQAPAPGRYVLCPVADRPGAFYLLRS